MLAPLALIAAAAVPQVTGPTSFDAFRAGLAEPLRIGLVRDTKRIDLDVLERFVALRNEEWKSELVLIDGWDDEERERATELGIDVAAVIRKATIAKGRPQKMVYGPIGTKTGRSVRYIGVSVDLEVDLVGALDGAEWTKLGRWEREQDLRRAPRSIDWREVKGDERRVDPAVVIESLFRSSFARVEEIRGTIALDTPPGRLAEWYPQLNRDEQLRYWARARRQPKEKVALPFAEMYPVALSHWREHETGQRDRTLENALQDFASMSLSGGPMSRSRVSIRSTVDFERVLEERRRSFEDWMPPSFSAVTPPFVLVRDELTEPGWLADVSFPDVFKERVRRVRKEDIKAADAWKRVLRKIDGAGLVGRVGKKYEVIAGLEPEEVTSESVAALLRDALAPRWPTDE